MVDLIEEPRKYWTEYYDWKERGDEWSVPWGGPQRQWEYMILPRIRSFVPAGTALEIAPGFGRWTQFLAPLCKRLILVDISEKCIESCRERFREYSHLDYYVNDGVSLAMVPDETIDFVFSVDSLVHVEADNIKTYLSQIARKLKPGGAGFVHHSNIGKYKMHYSWVQKIPPVLRRKLSEKGWIDDKHQWRAFSVTAEKFRQYAEKHGFQDVRQELVNAVGTKRLIDCFSTFKKSSTQHQPSPRMIKNRKFIDDAKRIKDLPVLCPAAKDNPQP